MADSGFEIYGAEVRQDVLDGLLRREPHFFEPRLKDKLARVLASKRLQVGPSIDIAFDASVYIVTVGTPLRSDGFAELEYIERAARQVAAALKDGDLVILRSTVKLGTARGIVARVLAETHKTFEIAVCPERTLEGRALLELHELPQVVGADEPETRYRCSQLFSLMTPTIVTVSSLEAAELVKLVDNTYRDVTFAFANEVAHLCGRAGLSASEVIAAGKLGYRRTNTAAPGPVGGPCLEKDPHILSQSASEFGVEMLVTNAARKTNEAQPALIAELLAQLTHALPGFADAPRICILGLAFKGIPSTDDLRGTMAKPIIAELARKYPRARVVGYDPVVAPDKARAYLGIEIAPDPEEAFTKSDIVVIANNHPAFSTIDLATLAERMRRPGVVYDLWNMFDDVTRSMPANVHYVGLGSENAAVGIKAPPRRTGTPPRTYVVTGGTGFIGASLVRRLLADGHEVRVIDNDLRGNARRLDDAKGRLEIVNCDVRNGEAVTKASKGAQSILHLAALNGTENFYKRPELVLDVGVRGMLAVMEAAKANGIRELVVASSSEAYQTPASVPTAEDVPLLIPDPWNPRYSYGGSKAISEIIAANYNRDLLERVMIFRPHNVYGPDMGLEHVLPQLVLRAHANIRRTPSGPVPIEIQGDGTQTRSFVHVSDFIDGVMVMLERGKTREVYHIGTEEEVTIQEIVRRVFECFGREPTLVPTPLPPGGTMRRCPSIRKLAALGFRPKVRLQDGIGELARWYVANHAERGGLAQPVGNGSGFPDGKRAMPAERSGR